MMLYCTVLLLSLKFLTNFNPFGSFLTLRQNARKVTKLSIYLGDMSKSEQLKNAIIITQTARPFGRSIALEALVLS